MKSHTFTAIAAAIMVLSGSAFEAHAMPAIGQLQFVSPVSAADSLIEQVQYRRGVRGPAPRVRGPVRRGGNGGAAAAAIIGLGVLGAIAAGSAASAAPAECWIERRRVVDDWGQVVGVRRVRVCR